MKGTIFHLRRVEGDTFITPLRQIDIPILSKASVVFLPLDYQRQPEDPLSTNGPSWAMSCRQTDPTPCTNSLTQGPLVTMVSADGAKDYPWAWLSVQALHRLLHWPLLCDKLLCCHSRQSFDPAQPPNPSFKYSSYFPGSLFKKDPAPIQHA